MAVCTQAACQTDTIAYPYRYYFPPLSDVYTHLYVNIPGECFLVGTDIMTQEELNIQKSSEIIENSDIYIGSIAEREMEVIGVAIEGPDILGNTLFGAHMFEGPGSVRLAVPGNGTAVDIWETALNIPDDLASDRILKALVTSHDPPFYSYGHITEIMFDTAYHFDEGDTIYITQCKLQPSPDNPDITKCIQRIPHWSEWHRGDTSPAASNWHLPGLLYAGYIDGEWMQGTFHGLPILWAIVRFPDDTCPAPQELRATAIGEGTEFLQFDTMGNHAAWEISYGPSGTAPDDGTVVQTTIPQAVIGNLDPTAHYVAYCRARCDFARSEWSPWSDSIGFTPSLAGIDDAARPQLFLAPNPAHGKVRIACSHAMQAVTLIAADGTNALTLHPDAAEATIDLHALPAGTYTIVAATAAGTAVRRLVRQ